MHEPKVIGTVGTKKNRKSATAVTMKSMFRLLTDVYFSFALSRARVSSALQRFGLRPAVTRSEAS